VRKKGPKNFAFSWPANWGRFKAEADSLCLAAYCGINKRSKEIEEWRCCDLIVAIFGAINLASFNASALAALILLPLAPKF